LFTEYIKPATQTACDPLGQNLVNPRGNYARKVTGLREIGGVFAREKICDSLTWRDLTAAAVLLGGAFEQFLKGDAC
jgi:hypothetical protein